uniref:C2H2-type domain-containing protein n=1 Tax=Phytophthora ramorum TaxID=164328 RepID=H3HCK0_PHYRM
MEQIWELPSGKCFRKYSPEHPLFEAGTRLWAAKYYQQAESMVQPEEEVHTQDQTSSLTCRLANCNVSFQSVTAYEEHYDIETHDAFFKILSKKKPMYACLVDGCPELFQHDDKRTRHLIQVHQYPKSFSFHQRCKQKTKAVKGTTTSVDAETLKKREARKRRRQQKKKKLLGQAQASETTDVDMAELEENMRELRIPKNIHFGRKQRI